MHGEMFGNTEATSDCEGAAHSAASHNTGAASSFTAAYPVPAPVVVVLICQTSLDLLFGKFTRS